MRPSIQQNNLGNYIVPEELRGGVCLDIGANVGSFTCKYKDFFGLLHYYEPITDCFNVIKEKLEVSNNPLTNVVGFNKACYSTSGQELEILLHINNDSGSSAIKTNLTEQHEEWKDGAVIQKVSTVSLEDVIKEIGGDIDYCKCDCETSEYYIFMDKDLSSINYIGMEIHWQMGQEYQLNLFKHFSKTHRFVMGHGGYTYGINREILLQRK
tara:strand:+ start:390 stop:1022 length:633 start_codon:yes stop_codon:yes gene_type:complete